MYCKNFLYLTSLLVIIGKSTALNCYQCNGSDSSHPFQCNEWLGSDIDLVPTPCDQVYGAKYCIKHTGRFEGGIGTKRYCSSLDLGNYCNYVQQPGDKLSYRSCVSTCTGDGCNSLSCYQCSGSESMDCSDTMIHMEAIEPKSCDHVFEAQYCIKSTSLDGGIGTKRYCSSLDLGNYCNYVKQPGDKLSYRSCVYTCEDDGCNPGSTVSPGLGLVSFLVCFVFGAMFS